MPQLLPITGSLVGSTSFAYKPFKDDKGDEVPGGTSYAVFVSASLDGEPDRVKVTEDQFVQLQKMGFAADVHLLCVPVVQRGRVGYKCESIRKVEAGTGVISAVS